MTRPELIRSGRGRFTVDGEDVDAGPGDIVVGGAETPQKFVNTGAEPLRQINIHPVARMETTWLE